MLRALIILFVFIASAPLIANASQQKITSSLILEKNKEMQALLQKRDPKQTIDFLHSHVSESAVFKVSFENTTLPKNMAQQNFEMDKAGYINSFLQGLHYVDEYNIKIDTKNIEIADNGQTAIVEESITEEGVMLNPDNVLATGIPFISNTSCKTIYTIANGVIQSDKAQCHTQTGEASAI